MSTTEPAVAAELAASETAAEPARHPERAWLRRFDHGISRLGDWLNPILVKESRQALKSKQFAITFSLLLVLVWVWSLLAGLWVDPSNSAFSNDQAQGVFFGYFCLLAFPLIVVVPYGAFRSLAGEIEDGTYELLSITTLRPGQIVGGKLGSALLQMMIYLSAVSPCLAFTYLLRGIDIVTIGAILLYVTLGSAGLSVIALLLATVSNRRHWQIMLSVLLVLGLGLSLWLSYGLCFELLQVRAFEGAAREAFFWIYHAIFLAFYFAFFAIAFLSARARITFPSENRTTALRVALPAPPLVLLSAVTYGILESGFEPETAVFGTALAAVYWAVAGSLAVGESSRMSARVLRQLPVSMLGRACSAWFNPGPATGYVFAMLNLLAVPVIVTALAWMEISPQYSSYVPMQAAVLFSWVIWLYLVIYLGLARLVLGLLHRIAPAGVFLGFLVTLLMVLAGFALPMIVRTVWEGTYFTGYTLLHITDPFWTSIAIFDTVMLHGYATPVVTLLGLAAVIVLLLNLPAICRGVLYERIATPVRIAADDALLRPAAEPEAARGPWD